VSRFKPLTKTQYDALSHGERIDYITAAIQARASDLYLADPIQRSKRGKAPPQGRQSPQAKARRKP
jgi:hypothetical protein